MASKAIKRHEALKPFSRDHHHGLLLCWKIREGLKHNIDLKRIKQYTDWFWKDHLCEHFEAEEKYMFPIMPADDKLILQAYREHRKLQYLFEDSPDTEISLQQIEQGLDAHIRFEERILFNAIQEKASPEQLQHIVAMHQDTFVDNWEDEFWKMPK